MAAACCGVFRLEIRLRKLTRIKTRDGGAMAREWDPCEVSYQICSTCHYARIQHSLLYSSATQAWAKAVPLGLVLIFSLNSAVITAAFPTGVVLAAKWPNPLSAKAARAPNITTSRHRCKLKVKDPWQMVNNVKPLAASSSSKRMAYGSMKGKNGGRAHVPTIVKEQKTKQDSSALTN